MKSAKIFLAVAVVSVFLFIGWSNALAMQSVGGNLNGFSTGKQIGAAYSHLAGVTTTSFIKKNEMEWGGNPTDKKDPADER